MLKIENLSYSFPQKDLFKNISFTLEDAQHCALIGSSGCGKSTLVNILLNPEKYMFDGKLEKPENFRAGYVSQFSKSQTDSDLTVFEYISEEFVKIQTEITSICTQMETSSDIETLLEQYQNALDNFEAIDGDNFESNIIKDLNLANLSDYANKKISKLSSGEFKLVQIIREMLIHPHILIMDEPDVFLDFDHLKSLKDLINSHNGIILVITHNRYLLNHCFNKIIHIENHDLQEFNGNYIDYNFSLLQTKIELQELAMADTSEIERNQVIIEKLRNDASNHSNAAIGRAVNARASIIKRLEERRIKEPFVEIKQPELNLFTDNNPENTVVLKVDNYSVGFNSILLENVTFEINSNDKVAIIGPNGSGKTTLIRDIFKNDHSSITIDNDTTTAFLSQLQGEILNESKTIFDEFFDLGLNTYQEVEAYIQSYGFDKDSIHQKINTFSGGEKNILQLAKISTSNANLLLLDEPTSHLDTYSQIALEKAINDYTGAVLMISHDFYSIANCMDYVLIIENKTIRKMSMRKFRKMIYADYFDVDYLELEKKKKEIETKIAQALKNKDFNQAKLLSEDLERLIKKL